MYIPPYLRQQKGFSIIEIMIAMTVGFIVAGGALSVYVRSSDSYRFNESQARLQENARVALEVVLPDARSAGFWAQTEFAGSIRGRVGNLPLDLSERPANECYPGFSINLVASVEAADDTQTGAANPFASCVDDTARLAGTDIVVVRHASDQSMLPAALEDDKMYVITSLQLGEVFTGDTVPSGFAATDPINELITNLYYIAPDSSAGEGIPALRRIRLTNGPTFEDVELIPGVEDLQVEFGVDTGTDNSVNAYVPPGHALLATSEIIATRIWFRVRSDNAELGFQDNNDYIYAGKKFSADDAFRRLLVSRTISIRNRARSTS